MTSTATHAPPPEVMTTRQAATYLGLSRVTLMKGLAAGTIPGHRHGRRWLIARAGLDAWLAGDRPPQPSTRSAP